MKFDPESSVIVLDVPRLIRLCHIPKPLFLMMLRILSCFCCFLPRWSFEVFVFVSSLGMNG